MRLYAAALLILALWPMCVFLPGRERSPPAPDGSGRYRGMAAGAWRRFGLTGAAVPLLLARPAALWRLPTEFAAVRAWAGLDDTPVGTGLMLSFALLAGAAAWRGRRGRGLGTAFGDATSILAQGGDSGGALWLAVTAGVTEELYFRLALPLLAALATGGALAGFAGSALLFALAHRYQGWRGMVATGAAAVALTALYLATGSLLAAMVLHATTDAFHLVARPAAWRWGLRHRR